MIVQVNIYLCNSNFQSRKYQNNSQFVCRATLYWFFLQVRMAVFSQHHVDGLDLTSNPLLYMMRCFPVSFKLLSTDSNFHYSCNKICSVSFNYILYVYVITCHWVINLAELLSLDIVSHYFSNNLMKKWNLIVLLLCLAIANYSVMGNCIFQNTFYLHSWVFTIHRKDKIWFQIRYLYHIWLNKIFESLCFFQGVPEQKLRSHLGSFGVTGNLALQPMYTLSGNLMGFTRSMVEF